MSSQPQVLDEGHFVLLLRAIARLIRPDIRRRKRQMSRLGIFLEPLEVDRIKRF
jgi:hypothetical protein